MKAFEISQVMIVLNPKSGDGSLEYSNQILNEIKWSQNFCLMKCKQKTEMKYKEGTRHPKTNSSSKLFFSLFSL